MSTIHPSRLVCIGSAIMFAFTLLVPSGVMAEEEVAALAPVAAPAVVGTSADDARTTRALAAENALQNSDIGSMQEERLLAIVAATASRDEASGDGTVKASRVLVAQQAL